MDQINWDDLTFSYTKTDCIVRAHYAHGAWCAPYRTSDPMISIHAAAAGLQYAQQVFEGLKAYRHADGVVTVFRSDANARRMQESAKAMYIEPVPEDLFWEAVEMAVVGNMAYLPPADSKASLYIRPILFCTSPRISVSPGDEFELCVVVSPVGPYYATGYHSTPFIINRHVDRAAPLGTGRWKAGGNYGGSFRATVPAHEQGYGVLFLDSAEHRYLDECGGANVFFVKDGVYITPLSQSILPSIINSSLMQLCGEMGIGVEQRRIEVDELGDFSEAASCGTGAAISPINRIVDPDTGKVYEYGEGMGPVSERLYERLRDIQYGRVEDVHGWNRVVNINK